MKLASIVVQFQRNRIYIFGRWESECSSTTICTHATLIDDFESNVSLLQRAVIGFNQYCQARNIHTILDPVKVHNHIFVGDYPISDRSIILDPQEVVLLDPLDQSQ
jgi:hypothetical protein